jgi:hypothetical protein
MKLMVAGCSFSAVSQTQPGTAWSERLAEKLGGWELVNLARQGCSNGGIRALQAAAQQTPAKLIRARTGYCFGLTLRIHARYPYDRGATRVP